MGRAISLAYLWNAVRVQGGAYGTGMLLHDSSLAGFYSYRDPDAGRTLQCYQQAADFLETLDGMDMTSFILGAVAESDPLLTPRMKGKDSDAQYWRRAAYPDLCRVRQEMLATAAGDLTALAGSVRAVAGDGAVCVLGSQRQIDACSGKLDVTEIL